MGIAHRLGTLRLNSGRFREKELHDQNSVRLNATKEVLLQMSIRRECTKEGIIVVNTSPFSNEATF